MLASERIWAFRFLKDGNTIALFTYDSFDGRMIKKSGNLRTMVTRNSCKISFDVRFFDFPLSCIVG